MNKEFSERIHFIDGYKIDEYTKLNKYTSFDYFQKNVTNKNLYFVSPESWRDPFEQLYYKAEGYEKYGYKKKKFFCMCLTENSSENEDAAWTLYSKNSTDKVIKITFNAFELLKQLDSRSKNENFEVYIGKVNYTFSSGQISGLSNKSENEKEKKFYEKCFHESMTNEDFFRLMLLKRKAFQFEREVRLFLIPKNENNQTVEKIEFSNKLISKLTLAPLQPFSVNDIRKKIYNRLQGTEEAVFKNKLKSLLPDLNDKNIQQSGLYKGQKKIKKV